MTPLTQTDLDKAGCDNPKCTHDHSVLYLVAECHPNSGLAVSYVKATGTMKFECRECEADVATIAVAHGATPS